MTDATETPATTGGRPARELSDEELEQQGKAAHDTRNWVFLNGTAEQFATHTARMLELEQEYLRRHPKRTWQGSGGALPQQSEADILKQSLESIVRQLVQLIERVPPETSATPDQPPHDPVRVFLERIAGESGGRMNKLEAHQVAREVGLERSELAKLYTADPPLLATDKQDRVITDAGRAALATRG